MIVALWLSLLAFGAPDFSRPVETVPPGFSVLEGMTDNRIYIGNTDTMEFNMLLRGYLITVGFIAIVTEYDKDCVKLYLQILQH